MGEQTRTVLDDFIGEGGTSKCQTSLDADGPETTAMTQHRDDEDDDDDVMTSVFTSKTSRTGAVAAFGAVVRVAHDVGDVIATIGGFVVVVVGIAIDRGRTAARDNAVSWSRRSSRCGGGGSYSSGIVDDATRREGRHQKHGGGGAGTPRDGE